MISMPDVEIALPLRAVALVYPIKGGGYRWTCALPVHGLQRTTPPWTGEAPTADAAWRGAFDHVTRQHGVVVS